jgi:hypothetical protein
VRRDRKREERQRRDKNRERNVEREREGEERQTEIAIEIERQRDRELLVELPSHPSSFSETYAPSSFSPSCSRLFCRVRREPRPERLL